MDVFCRFLPDPVTRDRLAQEMAYTMNLTKEQTAFIAASYKPNISLTPISLQVNTVPYRYPLKMWYAGALLYGI